MKLNEILLNEFWRPIDNYSQENYFTAPEIRPVIFDKDLESYLKRLDTWGKLKFIYRDEKGKKSEITRATFLKKMQSNDELMKLYGKFRVELISIVEVEFIREYVGLDGKMKSEIFRVEVKLKPELTKGLSMTTKVFNWLR